MKSNIFPIIIVILLIGGILMFSSTDKKPSTNLTANSPTSGEPAESTPTLIPIDIPTITPNEVTPTEIVPTKEPSKENSKIQIVKATYGPPLGFSPNELTVKAGTPVRIEVAATVDGRGCMSTIMIPGLDNRIQTLVKSQTNVFEFTPQTPGKYPITCAMGVPHGTLIVE